MTILTQPVITVLFIICQRPEPSSCVLRTIRTDTCGDELLECDRLAREGNCFASLEETDKYRAVIYMLTYCRQSCKQVLANKTISGLATLLGGVDDVVLDAFGQPVPLCDQGQGVDSLFRKSLLEHQLINTVQPAWVPSFHPVGWEKQDIPAVLLGMLNIARRQGGLDNSNWGEQEVCIPQISTFNCQELVEDGRECSSRHSKKELYKKLPTQLQETIMEHLISIGEQFSGVRLMGTSVYGIRRYTRGAWLVSHLDHMHTHVVSAILNIGQQGEPWPLFIQDNQANTHQVLLEPGKLLRIEE